MRRRRRARTGRFVFRATSSAASSRIVVEDSGPGIPSVVTGHESSSRSSRPSRVGEGTGLGLSVTLGVVQQLGGQITSRIARRKRRRRAIHGLLPIDSLADIPASKSTPSVRAASVGGNVADRRGPSARACSSSTTRPSIRSALATFLHAPRMAGGRSGGRRRGTGDVAGGQRSDFTIVISDLKMPDFSGIELHDHVAAVAPDLLDRIIFSTGDVASQEAAEFVRRTKLHSPPEAVRASRARVDSRRMRA